MGTRPEICHLKYALSGQEDVEYHGKSDNACKNGNEEPDALDEEPDLNLAQICK